MTLELSLLASIDELPRELFDELDGPAHYPFLRYDWLRALEESGVLGAERGWIPRHVVIKRRVTAGSEVLAVAPAYIKLHSMGEFVFDQSWAELSEMQLGVAYYPKLILAIPFTPATGPRVLTRQGLTQSDREMVLDGLTGALPDLAKQLGLSSVHILFPDEALSDELSERDWALRLGLQFQFKNVGCASFEDYLGGFKSKRRTQIRRERKSLSESGVDILARTGDSLSREDAKLAHQIYLTTVDKYVWGRRYLNRAFFERIFEVMPDAIHFVTARAESFAGAPGEVIAGAVNLLGAHALYGRYWGCFREVPFLHFNVCLYAGVEETIRRGLDRFEPGAGGEHKEGRGFSATITRSLHYVADRRLDAIVRDFLVREAEAVTLRAALDRS